MKRENYELVSKKEELPVLTYHRHLMIKGQIATRKKKNNYKAWLKCNKGLKDQYRGIIIIDS